MCCVPLMSDKLAVRLGLSLRGGQIVHRFGQRLLWQM